MAAGAQAAAALDAADGSSIGGLTDQINEVRGFSFRWLCLRHDACVLDCHSEGLTSSCGGWRSSWALTMELRSKTGGKQPESFQNGPARKQPSQVLAYICTHCASSLPTWRSCHRYCGIHVPASVVKCIQSGKWFCNGRITGTASCIVTHLVRPRTEPSPTHSEPMLCPLLCQEIELHFAALHQAVHGGYRYVSMLHD